MPVGLRTVAEVANAYRAARRAARLMLVLNLLLCVSKLVTGWLGDSFALIADGLNNLSDIGISAALYVGMSIAQRPPDKDHAYGYGKFEQEISRLISIVVLATGGGIVVEGIKRISHVDEPPDLAVLVVAGASILLKIYMYRYQNRIAIRLSSSALAADALNHKSDVAATACVLVGTAAIWLGGPAWGPADDVAAVGVGVLMVVAAGATIHTASHELLDQMPPPEVISHVRDLARSFPGVTGVDQVVGRKAGMHYLLDVHLEVPGTMTVTDGHRLGHQVKDWLMAELPEILDIVIHVEPTPEAEGDAT